MKLDLTLMQIILPTHATEVETFAAEELKSYIHKMTDISPSVVNEGDNTGAGIYVGATDYAAANNVAYTDISGYGEGWAIKAVDGNLILTGVNVRGVLYAVYHLLEDVLGVRWWNLWEEHVPVGNATVPADYAASGEPAFSYREIHITTNWRENINFARLRLNGQSTRLRPAYGGVEDFAAPDFVHTFNLYVPPYHHDTTNPFYKIINPNDTDYYVEHPEWFAWNNALQKRVDDQQLCLTNESLIEAVTEMVLTNIRYHEEQAAQSGKAAPRYYSLSPNDGAALCECEACTALREAKGNSGYLLTFVNRVAEAVAKVYPQIRIETLAYSNYVDVPKDDTKPADHVVITLCTAMEMLHNIHHPNNAGNKARIEAWSKLVAKGNFRIWDYVGNLTYNGICPSMMQYGTDFNYFSQMGLVGFFGENSGCNEGDFWDMKFWLMAKLLEKPAETEEAYSALMNDFLTGYYGTESGKYVRQYLDYVGSKANAYEGSINLWGDIIHPEYLTLEDHIVLDNYFEQAFAAAGDNETQLRRLRAARSGLDRVIIKNIRNLTAQAENLGISMPLDEKTVGKRLATTYTELVALRGDYDSSGESKLAGFSRFLREDHTENAAASDSSEFNPFAVYDADRITDMTIPGNFTAWIGAAGKLDPDSKVGGAIVCDVGAMYSDSRVINEFWAMTDSDDYIGIRYWAGTFDDAHKPIYEDICRLKGTDIIADGKYHLYKFEDVVFLPDHPLEFLAVCNDDCIQHWTIPKDYPHLKGKKVTLFVSLKVTGDITCADPNNMPVYRFDRFIIVE